VLWRLPLQFHNCNNQLSSARNFEKKIDFY
jgi:hypothetical protein